MCTTFTHDINLKDEEYGYVVINVCYGGFGLSKEAENYVKSKLKETSHDAIHEESRDTRGEQELQEATLEINTKKLIKSFYSNRYHPLLIEVVQKLGLAANGLNCKLELVRVPNEYILTDTCHIHEYDGNESINLSNSKLVAYNLEHFDETNASYDEMIEFIKRNKAIMNRDEWILDRKKEQDS